MDITFLQDYIAPIIVGICLCVGFIIKQWVKDVDNRFIPTINALIGLVLAMWLNGWQIEPQVILQGLFSGLASTGLFEAFRNIIDGGKK
jgi:hypothetical protein|nr:MAG TPA: hypothetical protein [Caudoviricetes sp.]